MENKRKPRGVEPINIEKKNKPALGRLGPKVAEQQTAINSSELAGQTTKPAENIIFDEDWDPKYGQPPEWD